MSAVGDTPAVGEPVDLSSCDREPIHIPGSIQPHGVLVAFDGAARVRMASANAAEHLGAPIALDRPLPSEGALADLAAAVQSIVAAGAEAALEPRALKLAGGTYDLVAHRTGGLLVVELERRAPDAPPLETFALQAQRAIASLQSETRIEPLLDAAVREVRALTGFDRVMAYQFQADDSGFVKAEARRADLEPFLGLRYPASDIPAQARRLYLLNPLRLIADVAYRPVPIAPTASPLDGRPLDLSFAVLRSVSPIHVEYLTNMGVQASMSISIVVGDRLWGLIACHHMTPRLVPYAVRMACHILAQVVSVLVGRSELADESARRERAMRVQTALLQRIALGTDPLRGLVDGEPSLRALVPSDGAVVTQLGKAACQGLVPSEPDVAAIVAWLRARGQRTLFATHHVAHDCPELAPHMAGMCGLLAAPFSREQDGYLLWFRVEEVETVAWGGNPDKHYASGPLGPRLTPRGSFAAWRETVRDRARAWSQVERDIAERLRQEMQQIALGQARARIQALEQSNAELDRVTYVVSHELRAPLRAASSLADFIAEDLVSGEHAQAHVHLATMKQRMVRLDDLIQAILRYSRAGHRRHAMVDVDVAELLRQTIELVSPNDGVEVAVVAPMPHIRTGLVPLQQVFANLLTNALRYGLVEGRGRIEVRVQDRGPLWLFSVSDRGAGIGPEHFERIFQLFSRVSNESGGTGIGLATVRRTVESYGGEVWVESALGEGATFHFTWPKEPGPDGP